MLRVLPRSLHSCNIASFRRTLFNVPDLSSLSPFSLNSDTAQKYHERKILPYTSRQLYDIVSDVRSYPHFVPFCIGSRIISDPAPEPSLSALVMEAELTVGFLAFRESYVSKVTCTPFESVEAVASSTTPLFKTLSSTWRFQPASPESPHSSNQLLRLSNRAAAATSGIDTAGPTLVTLDLAYAFASPAHATVSSAFFGQVSKLMVKAFEERCLNVYGPGTE